MKKQYTNVLTAELLASMARSVFSVENIAEMSDEARTLIQTQDDYAQQHPVAAIWRHVTVGSLTRDGGMVYSASSLGEVLDSSGEFVAMALVGDQVMYPDGSMARIISGSGSGISNNGPNYALVGSKLSNGDEIISSPQSTTLFCCRVGETMPNDFLVPVSQLTA